MFFAILPCINKSTKIYLYGCWMYFPTSLLKDRFQSVCEIYLNFVYGWEKFWPNTVRPVNGMLVDLDFMACVYEVE